MPRRPIRTALGALALGALAACFDGEALRGEPCTVDRDCGPRLECLVGGLCGEQRCDATTIELSTFAPDITLIVAYTLTMDDPVEGTDLTRWEQVLALVGEIGEALGDRVNLGMVVVPSVNAPTYDPTTNPCYTDASTHLLPAPGQGGLLLGVLPPQPSKLGEHPVVRGLVLALAGFKTLDPAGVRTSAIVIINDNTFNCRLEQSTKEELVELYDIGLNDRVADAAASGVPVFVVGVGVTSNGLKAPYPGATFKEVDPHLAFSELAVAGGRPRAGDTPYYHPDDADELIAALGEVPRAFADCRVSLGDQPAYPERLVITVDGVSHHAAASCADGHGWRWLPGEVPAALLCPTTCDLFRSTRALTIEPRCPPEPIDDP